MPFEDTYFCPHPDFLEVNCTTRRTANHPVLTDIPIKNLTKAVLRRLIEIKQDDIQWRLV